MTPIGHLLEYYVCFHSEAKHRSIAYAQFNRFPSIFFGALRLPFERLRAVSNVERSKGALFKRFEQFEWLERFELFKFARE